MARHRMCSSYNLYSAFQSSILNATFAEVMCDKHVYKHIVFYVLCISFLVLHLKCQDDMPMNSLSHYNADC